MRSIDFTIYPAIDLRKGQVVRLKQGDPGRQTVYSTDPAQTAQRWIVEGAEWLHVVDLDGALGESTGDNQEALRRIAAVCGDRAKLQYGGGLRNLESLALALEAGVSRVVVGTAAIEDPAFGAQALKQFGRRVAFALDANDGRLKSHGWQKDSTYSPIEFAATLAASGASTLIYTDISRDGMGGGVDWLTAADLARETGLEVIASGGVASLADVRGAKNAGLNGIIIGRALYDERVSLSEALSC